MIYENLARRQINASRSLSIVKECKRIFLNTLVTSVMICRLPIGAAFLQRENEDLNLVE
jgi:hypothetical protein